MFKTVFCLCWWYINNYKNKIVNNWCSSKIAKSLNT
jgi:hypothetical protein